jgi:hypothetical protein
VKPRIPRVTMVTAAERAPRLFTPNVYYGTQVIGVAVRLWPRRVPPHGHRMLSILWARPVTPPACGWSVGPVWKLDGETCVCTEPEGHDLPHKCPCGSWFEGCGAAPTRTDVRP